MTPMRMGLCAIAVAVAWVPEAHAVVVSTNLSTPIICPATIDGIYINFVTGVTGVTIDSVSGYDFSPYLETTGQLSFDWSGDALLGINNGGVLSSGSPSAPYLDLAEGAEISSTSFFDKLNDPGTAFLTAGTHILGFRFINEDTSAINYGYLTITTETGPPAGYPATITGWSYENTGAAITVVPEPTAGLMAALALGATQLRRCRRPRSKLGT